LESIGAVEKSKSRKDIYQEIVSIPVEPDFETDAVMQDDEDGLPSSNQSLLAAVRKVSESF
jgi:hypothetical protein